jgi:hypothetical protein
LVDKSEICKIRWLSICSCNGKHKETKRLTTQNHSVSILVRPEQNPTQNPIYLVGDKDKKYVEYPIFSIPGYDYGISTLITHEPFLISFGQIEQLTTICGRITLNHNGFG